MIRRRLTNILGLLTVCLTSVSISCLYAGPARPGVITVTQNDGSMIRVRIHGDEFHNYATTEEGYLIAPDADGDWAFAKIGPDGLPKATSVKAKPASRLSGEDRALLGSALRKGLRPAGATDFQRQLAAAARAYSLTTRSGDGSVSAPPLLGGTTWRPVGKKKVLVILAEYPDKPFSKGDRTEFDELLNSRNYITNGATGSVWKYYNDNSNGQFDPEFTVVGPYRLSHNRAWYRDRGTEMATEAARLADTDVDFSQFAENGTAHDFFVFYSGGAQSSGDPDGIWPHRSTMSLTLDGVRIPGYACSSELEPSSSGLIGNGLAGIGSFCHEFGHIIGWPDFYDTDTNDGSDGDGPRFFSLMDYGTYNNDSRTPPALGILERWMMGWAEPEVLTAGGDYNLDAVTEGKGYLVRTETEDDYFLLECRGAGKTVWDRKEYLDYYGYGQDWGLLVYHVNGKNTALWVGNSTNSAKGRECYKILYSNPNKNGTVEPAYIPKRCFYPGGSNVTSIASDTKSGFMSADGKKTEVEIPSIRLDEGQGAVRLSVSERSGSVTDIKSEVFQHDILLSWQDDMSTSWSVEWRPSGSEAAAGSLAGLSSREAHIPLLKADQEYSITITGNKGAKTSVTLKTERSGSGFPRIQLSKANPTSEESVLLTLVDCGEMSDLLWTVDGAKTDGLIKLRKGEHYVQAELRRPDKACEYFVRYVTVIL